MARLQAADQLRQAKIVRQSGGRRLRGCSKRRGVLLLVVLSLLALFALMMVSFVAITNHARRATESVGKLYQEEDATAEARKQLNEAAFQVARGAKLTSVLFPHSLLEDMYGHDTLWLRPDGNPLLIATITPRAGNQMLVVTPNTTNLTTAQLSKLNADLARRVGCVLTIKAVTDSVSFRIVGFDSSNTSIQLWNETALPLQGPDGAWGKKGINDDNNGPADDVSEMGWPGSDDLIHRGTGPADVPPNALGDPFCINGTPFGGTGFGFNPGSGQCNALDSPGPSGRLIALQPNYLWNNAAALANSNDPFLLGGANDDYDAPDYQNMVMGMIVPNQTNPALPPAAVIPSLHRPELVSYWMNAGGTPPPWSSVDFRRRVLLRPLVEDNPMFASVNPAFNPNSPSYDPANGVDVDNDGDGIKDSIWVDLAMPVGTRNGQTYKPLFAILCLDLDGRLNLNAHGAQAQADSTYYTGVDPCSPQYNLWGTNYVFANTSSGTGTPFLPRGMGHGPADVNLLPLFGGASGLAAYSTFFTDPQFSRYAPGGLALTGRDAALEANKWYEYGAPNGTPWWNWISSINFAGAYGSPPNRLTHGAIGIDPGGRPLYCGMGHPLERIADPYKLNLVKPSTTNSPFTVDELERLYRQKDADASKLPKRLATTFNFLDKSKIVTTDSWDVPAAAFKVPEYLRAATSTEISQPPSGEPPSGAAANVQYGRNWLTARLRAERIQDLLALRHYFTLSPRTTWDNRRTQMDTTDTWLTGASVLKMLPKELLAARKMDVNRAFGNARDDAYASNGIVDEPSEAPATVTSPDEPLTQYNPDGSSFNVAFNHTNEFLNKGQPAPPVAPMAPMARQIYARYLYVLAMLMIDTIGNTSAPDGYMPSWAGTGAAAQQARARWVAQWAVNVVDFRDRDSIMTMFEYDPNPFTAAGWRPDGDPTTDDGITGVPHVVWGCERPELLMTETLAFHDRRTEDLTGDNGSGTTTTGSPADTNFDQRKRPQGSLFIELYNPWAPLEPRPAELSNGPGGGVQLNRVTPTDSSGNMSPVWRMVIVPGTDSTLNPDPEPTGTGATFTFPSTSNVNRSIYFNDPAATGLTLPPATADGVRFFTTEAINPILPQQYAVVGPGENSTDTTYRDITVVGRTTMSDPLRDIDPTYLDVTPRIDMTAIGTPVVNNPGGSEPTASTIQGVVPVVIRNPARLSVSEPDPNSGADAYPAYTTVGTPNKLSGQNYYGSPLYDVPFDNTVRGRIPAVASALLENGIRTSVAVVHLQRLADPTRTFNAQTNPYRTIDSMPIDLTVFNGWSATAETSGGASLPGTMMFATHERGEQNTSAEGANNIWITHPNVAKTVSADTAYSPSGSNPPLFRYTLKHTLGFLNAKFNATSTTPTARRTGAGDPNKGDPDTTETPLPWLTWNNRPFVSPVELLLVPSATSARLLNPDLELPTPLPPPPRRPNDYYGVGSGSSPYTTESGPFSHLMNFFSYSNGTGSSTTDAARLYQILDFLGVPSPFVGTEFQANATSLADTSDPTFQHALYPPFHLSASYREPGRINLNTVASPDVWDGLMNYYPGLAYTPFALSRQGFTGGNWWDPSTSYPTRFANPFRSSAATMLNPLPPPGLTTEINGTMLRPTSVGASAPLFSFTSTNAYDNTTRSPFHRYHPLTRTSNLVTTRSNAYAVWITVGYFTVTSGAVNLAHPDGYYLGEEVGAATGKITRHRAFYIIDRSIPAGFVRGEDLNVGNTFRLMRFIE